MKEKVLYYCELCGTPYSNKKDAINCEAYHRTPKKLKNFVYKPKGVGPAWPYTIRVDDRKGHSCQYVYNGHEETCSD